MIAKLPLDNSFRFLTDIFILDLKSQITSLELKNKRLLEAFGKTSQELREIVYLTTGYRVDLLRNNSVNNQYKISSMYAETMDDFLLFEVS